MHEHVSLQGYFKQHNLQDSAPWLSAGDKIQTKPAKTDHSIWTLEDLGHKGEVALKSYNGHYISVNKNGQVHLAKDRGGDAHFTIVTEPIEFPGGIAIKDAHNGFLMIDAHGHLVSKKGLSETEEPGKLPFFRKHAEHGGKHH